MSRMIRLSLLAAVTTALVACGGGGARLGGGKEGAAKALFAASQPAADKSKSGMGLNVSGLDLRALTSAAQASGEVTASCAKSGTVKVAVNVSSISVVGDTIKFSESVTYNGCNQDGANTFDGSMALDVTITGTATTAMIALHLKGKIEISGDIEDFLDADITESISATATSTTSGTVTVKLDGTIKTSESSYAYANETLTITVDGAIPADDSGKT